MSIFTSCATFDSIKSVFKEAFGSDGKESVSSNQNKVSIKSSNVIQSNLKVLTNYEIPEDYSKAYSFRTGKPHALAKKIPAETAKLRTTNPSEYVKKCCEFIKLNSTDDFERIKIAHDIIALNIKYDAASFWSGNLPRQDYEPVLKTGFAVCEGYSNTFKKFMDVLGFKNQIVHGYARGVGTSLLTENGATNHAWNLVRIENEYYLIDSTWDSGYMEGKKSVQNYNTDWLFIKPEHFIYTHYPDNKNEQLLKSPFSKEEFLSLAEFRPNFFDVTESSVLPKKQNECKSSFEFDYSLKSGGNFSFTVADYSSNKNIQNATYTFNQENGKKTVIQFPKAGNYKINVFYFAKNAKSGVSCGEFYVKATEKSSILYPQLYTNSFSANLISPIEMPLECGKTYHFELSCPEKKFVAIICGNNFTQMNKNESGNFELDFTIPSGITKVNVGASSSERGSYQTIATYTCK